MLISLWDVWIIGGLPANCTNYEEIIPSTEELLYM